jgi:hypothetical protein
VILSLPLLVFPNHLQIFVFNAVKVALGIASAYCECRLYRALQQSMGNVVASVTLLLLATSAAMFHASVGPYVCHCAATCVSTCMLIVSCGACYVSVSASAFLPSTFSMYATMLVFASALEGDLIQSVGSANAVLYSFQSPVP